MTDNDLIMDKVFSKGLRLMGNHFQFSVVADDSPWANARIEDAVAEVKRIESLLTTYNDQSQTNLINAMAGIKPVKVDKNGSQYDAWG